MTVLGAIVSNMIAASDLPSCDAIGVITTPHAMIGDPIGSTREYQVALQRAWNLQRAIAVNQGIWKAADHPLQDIK